MSLPYGSSLLSVGERGRRPCRRPLPPAKKSRVFTVFCALPIFSLFSELVAQDGSTWANIGLKMGQHSPNMGQHSPQDGPTIAPRWANIAPRWAHIALKIGQHSPKIGHRPSNILRFTAFFCCSHFSDLFAPHGST